MTWEDPAGCGGGGAPGRDTLAEIAKLARLRPEQLTGLRDQLARRL